MFDDRVFNWLVRELTEAPTIDAVRRGFADTLIAIAERDDDFNYILGLAWGENPLGDPPAILRWTCVLRLPHDVKNIAAPRRGVAWISAMATSDVCLLNVYHDNGCPACSGGRAWSCNCVPDLAIETSSPTVN